jgi:hypothetical protein
MMRFNKTLSLVGVMLVHLPAISLSADTQVELQRNPFERPDIKISAADTAENSNDPANQDDPGLRAVLIAGSKSVVNFGGVILQIGESTNGYKLLAVEEDRVTFRNKGKKVTFSLYEQERDLNQ